MLAATTFLPMPLQNRVHPSGELHAVPFRGTMMGNRGGKFHRDDQTLSQQRWASRRWICCELDFKGRKHAPMGTGYTALFFLDPGLVDEERVHTVQYRTLTNQKP